MPQTLSLMALVAGIFAASLELPVFYKANPDYVRSMTTVAALKEFKDGDLISNEAARIPASRDQIAVNIHMKESKETAADGLLAKQEITTPCGLRPVRSAWSWSLAVFRSRKGRSLKRSL